ncbi:MAG: translation initiation factor [bacterium]|jgi:translation initiation factor 1
MKKTRIETSANAIGFQSPFAALSIEGLPEGPAEPIQRPLPPTKLGRVVLRREKSERGGKTVVVVSDFATHISEMEIAEFARKARQSCGCGGTVRGREIELQGDNPPQVRAFFEKAGFRVAGV